MTLILFPHRRNTAPHQTKENAMHTMQENTATATTLGQRTAALRENVGQLEIETAMGENVPADVLSDVRAEHDFLEVLSLCREDRLVASETAWIAERYPEVSGPLESGQSGRAWIAGQRVTPVVNVPTRTDRALAQRIAANAVALERIADRILALAGDTPDPSMLEMAAAERQAAADYAAA